MLIDYPSYARWNSFMREASDEVDVGKKLTVTIYMSSGSKMSFKPKLLVVDQHRELGWRGRLIIKGLLKRNRRLAKDVEATIESAVTWLYIASVKLMSRRLAAA